MSYTSKELIEIARNIEAYRLERVRVRAISPAKDAQLFRIIKDLYNKSHGQYTKEATQEYIPHINTFT